MLPSKTFTIIFCLVIFAAAFMACTDSGYYDTTHVTRHSYTSPYSYPASFGCVHSKKTKSTTFNHPIYGKVKVKTTKNKTTC